MVGPVALLFSSLFFFFNEPSSCLLNLAVDQVVLEKMWAMFDVDPQTEITFGKLFKLARKSHLPNKLALNAHHQCIFVFPLCT
jgi:hypothetical protein